MSAGTAMAFRHRKGKDVVLTAAPAWTFRDKSAPARDAGIPGPGSYMAVIDHESQHRRSPGCFFPTDLALKGAAHMTPGPGEYTIPAPKPLHPARSIGAKHPNRVSIGGPGPGAYKASNAAGLKLARAAAYSFGHQPRLRDTATAPGHTPGPGDYSPVNPWERKVLHLSPGSSPPTAEAQGPSSPGPGDYDAEVAWRHRPPAFTMGSRAGPRQKAPEGGEYNAKDDADRGTFKARKAHGGPFAHSNRFNQHHEAIPGPGSYQLDVKLPGNFPGRRAGFGSAAAIPRVQGVTPGPGDYQAKVSMTLPQSHVVAWAPSATPWYGGISCSPGPGAYDVTKPHEPHRILPGCTLGARPHTTPGLLESSSQPGPGAYEAPSSSPKPGITFKSRYSTHTVLDGGDVLDPRPSTLKSYPAFSMRTRPRKLRKDKIPGPGAYDHE